MKTETPPDARDSTAESPGPAGSQRSAAEQGAAQAFHDAGRRIAEIREYLSYYVAAKADAIKLSIRAAVFYSILGIVGLLAAGAVVVMGVVLLLVGAAHGIGSALGGRDWLGDLIIGVTMLVIAVIGAKIVTSKVFGVSRRETVAKYESRKRDQRSRFGQDVKQRAERQ